MHFSLSLNLSLWTWLAIGYVAVTAFVLWRLSRFPRTQDGDE